jgi:hypothetical protein
MCSDYQDLTVAEELTKKYQISSTYFISNILHFFMVNNQNMIASQLIDYHIHVDS